MVAISSTIWAPACGLLAHRRHHLLHPVAALPRRRGDGLQREPASAESSTSLCTLLRGALDGAHGARHALAAPRWITPLISAVLASTRSARCLHLVRHDREGPPVLARLRGDDRRVQREQIRLVRHVVDDGDDRCRSSRMRPPRSFTMPARRSVSSRIEAMPSMVSCTLTCPSSELVTTASDSFEVSEALTCT